MQHLSFADAAFDLCTSTVVFEHVPDDLAGFRELHRARLDNGKPVHLLAAAYHGDRINGAGSVLVYRDYGTDIVERVRQGGFNAAALWPPSQDWFDPLRTVVVATRS